MSKKNLLNEAQVRQFMKLARLEPLAPGFIEGLKKESHGRGRKEGAGGYGHPDANSRLEEVEADPEALEDYAAGDIERGEPGEAEEDELEAGEEEGLDDEVLDDEEGADLESAGGGGRTVSVDDFLAALETALEDVVDEEVEIDSDEMDVEEDELGAEDDEVEADVELDAEEDEMDVEEDELLERQKSGGNKGDESRSRRDYEEVDERQAYGGNKGDESRSRRDYEEVDERQKYGGNKGDESRSRRDYEEVDEGAFGGGDKYEKLAKGKKGSYAPDPEEGEEEWKGSAPGPKPSRPRIRARDVGGGTQGTYKPIVQERTDALVEEVTKRVAARILKSALRTKR